MNDKIQFAIRMLNEMEYEKGIEILEEVLAEDPKNETALYNVALAYNSTDNPKKAAKTFEYYLKLYKPNGNILAGLGYSLYLCNEIEKSKEMLEEAVKIDPLNVYALRNLSGVLGNLGDHEKAKDIFDRLLAIDSNDYRSLCGLGIIEYQKQNYDASEKYFFQVMALNISDEAKDPAREYLSKIAENTLKGKGFRIDAVMYLVAAINTFSDLDIDNIKSIAFEIATLGHNGLDINNPDTLYKINSLNGKEMSALCAVCYMYAGFQIQDPSLDIGIDLSAEYDHAKKLIDADTI